MLGRSLCLLIGLSASPAWAHHAECVVDAMDGFMSCGAHSGAIAFRLQSFGHVTERTRDMVLCSDRKVQIKDLKFSWVESDDMSQHFPMKGMRYRQVSENCTMLGGLDFTPPTDYSAAEQNAWRLDVHLEGVNIPSRIYVEAVRNP
jgi:hypothetical protein